MLAQDAYGEGPTRRVVTSLSGTVQHGNSGGPAVDASGAVQSTVFAARAAGSGGYGVPASVVRRDARLGGQPGLDRALRPLEEVERRLGLLERRDHVDARHLLARLA